jgi:hypothetical protein
MQRGKASVQRYEGDGREMLKPLESRADAAKSATAHRRPQSGAAPCGPEGEMAGHIVDQLRRAYDELLHEPIPDHLRQLLASLSDTENQS